MLCRACAEAAALHKCDPSAAAPLVAGIDCGPYARHCLRLACPQDYPLGSKDDGASHGEQASGGGAAQQEARVIDTEGRVVEAGWRGHNDLFFVRLAGQSVAGVTGAEAGGAFHMPGLEVVHIPFPLPHILPAATGMSAL